MTDLFGSDEKFVQIEGSHVYHKIKNYRGKDNHRAGYTVCKLPFSADEIVEQPSRRLCGNCRLQKKAANA